ncbi:MAG: PAS domain-containing protein [Rudanella sp.]|nr:PAS domain-containing protein [Rudanella sp.]
MKTGGKTLSSNLFPVVGVGASAGGLEAFKKLLAAIPERSGMAWVLVQHLSPTHESVLPELLQKVTTIPVLEISDDIKVEPDHIYILPSNKMMVANDGVLELSPRSTKKGEPNLPIDLFFASLAEIHQNEAIGVVLSGTGSDGTKGLKAIKDHGGMTLAQNEVSAAYDGMPTSAVYAGVVDFVLAPEDMPQKLLVLTTIIHKNGGGAESPPEQANDVFRQMLSLLRIRKGTDFTYYKQTTIHRRILRRMAINKNEQPADYLAYLRQNKPEQDALYQDLLIPVTSFFRDSKTFTALCETIFPLLVQNKTPGEPVRVWVAGCSTGEEAYSMAICFNEFLGDNKGRIQLFATDLSEPAIIKARSGIYTKTELEGVSPQRLQTYFAKSGSNYLVNKQVRDMCVFAHHNFLKDPPFGKMDFVSCRNVLIYMEPYLQKKALTTFHYSLNANGFLLLGKSETIGGVPDLFTSVAKTEKLFSRKNVPGRFMLMASVQGEQATNSTNANPKTELMRTDFQKTADDIILSKYTPVGVVVNEALDIVHFRGSTGNFLEQLSGKPTHNLLQMAKHGLSFELRNILHKAKKKKTTVIKATIPVQVNGNLRTVTIEAIPLPNTIEPHYLVLFHETNATGNEQPAIGSPKGKSTSKKDGKDLRIHQLEQELAQTREDMRSITEDQEAINEELQSTNEELLSGIEELQSLNEELETSKEELQSTNEELLVVNQEMIGLNEQTTRSRDYAEAVIGNIREPLLVLDSSLRVKTANSTFYKAFQVNEQETEGVLIYDLGNKQWNIPELRLLLEKILPEKSVFNDFELTHTFSTIGERVMLLNARELLSKNSSEELILLSIEDVTEKSRALEKERLAEKRFQFIADAMPQKVWTADAAGQLTYVNQSWLTYSGFPIEDLKGWGGEKVIHADDLEETVKRWQHSMNTGTDFDLENRILNVDEGYKWHLSRGSAQKDDKGNVYMWIGTNTEIDKQKKQKTVLEAAVVQRTHELQQANETLIGKNADLDHMNKELESFTYISSHDLQEPLRKIQTLANRILEKESGNLTDNGKDYFARMQSAAARMQQLIQDLLAFSRVNTTERVFDKTDLNLLTKDVLSELEETIQEKHATVDVVGLGSANVIVFQFRQLMHNLIGNALKFSDAAIPPHITISSNLLTGRQLYNKSLLPDKTYCHITVADNGIGFDPQYSERIFGVFQRLHGRDHYKGTGIGLAIVKKIVENHYGFITATSELGKGTRFDMYFPVN